jgi:ABC-type glycerol-3-phosphate transport system substrate-binding protein
MSSLHFELKGENMLKKSLVSLSAITTMIVLSSCGGGSSSTDSSGETTTYTGYLVDSAVAGAWENN